VTGAKSQRLNILPFENLQGIVYEDRNVNGIKDTGEPGIANILVKDTRGRLFRSDADGNGQHDPDETAPAGVVLKAKDKEVVTGIGGQFIFRNLPVLWQQWVEIKKEQPFYNKTINNLKK
jgi:hypothetical protein